MQTQPNSPHESFITQNFVLLDIVSHNIKNFENRLLEEHGITQKQARTLIFLYFNKEKCVNQKYLEENFRLSRSTITSMMANLEKLGLIYRSADGTDGRNKIITMTQKGINSINNIMDCHKTIDEFLKAILTETEYSELNRILQKILKVIDYEKVKEVK